MLICYELRFCHIIFSLQSSQRQRELSSEHTYRYTVDNFQPTNMLSHKLHKRKGDGLCGEGRPVRPVFTALVLTNRGRLLARW